MPRSQGAAIGKNKVEIVAHRKTGKKVPDPARFGGEVDHVEQFIPYQFNRDSELFRNVTPGKNVLDFDLMSK